MVKLKMNFTMQNFLSNLKYPAAVVAHDAGAANIISAILIELNRSDFQFALEGQALDIMLTGFPGLLNMSVHDALKGAKFLISGTSGIPADLEHEARVLASNLGIPSIGVIDHWVNYKQRFSRAGEVVLPDEIWVSDHYAFDLAKSCFPGHPIRQVRNYYLERQVRLAKEKSLNTPQTKGDRILYVLEPVVEYWGDSDIAGEFQALEYFAQRMPSLGVGRDAQIRLRPHPRDELGKYDSWAYSHPELDIQIDNTTELSDLIGWANMVVGCNTAALVIALNANRRTISTLPPIAPPCVLPHKGIEMLREL